MDSMQRVQNGYGVYGFILSVMAAVVLISPAMAEDTVTFTIEGFAVEGNNRLPEDAIYRALEPFTGDGKTAADVEKARSALETLYRERGYPTILVNIPEQSVETGTIRLAVVEGRIRVVRVTGNRYFTREKVLEDLPSFAPGEVLYLPRARRELNRINRNPDFKVAPVLAPGKYPGTVDVEMKVKDRFPLHGNLELNNRSSHDTSDLRLNASLHYDNLWQKEHSISFQYQTSPQASEEVQALSGSYLLHAPWNDDHLMALFGVWSDSDTAFGNGFQVVGRGFIVGARYVMPLPEYISYTHHMTIGLDYKEFDEETRLSEGDGSEIVPISYMPLSFAYGAQVPDKTGATRFEAGLNLGFRGAVTTQRDFENKRYAARGNYLTARLGIERTQKLPALLKLWLKLDGQATNQPLISNEQYVAGGMNSVRGYKESEVLGDEAFHSMIELRSPELVGILGGPDEIDVNLYCFYDYATLRNLDPLPSEEQPEALHGAGAGVRGFVTRYFGYEAAWGVALADTGKTPSGTSRVYFKGKFAF